MRPLTIALLLCAASLLCCSGDEEVRPGIPDGGWLRSDADLLFLPTPDSQPVPDGLPSDEGGPRIVILEPTADAVVVDNLLKVRARITDDDGVDPTTVTVTLQEGQPMRMTPGPEADHFEALLDLSSRSGVLALWVTATDVQGRANSAVRTFERDAGPQITFLGPTQGAHYKGSTLVKVVVVDPAGLSSFEVRLGDTKLPLIRTTVAPDKALYTGTLAFDDPFDPALSGAQVLTATAVNKNDATSVEQISFVVDDVGPEITIITPVEGQILGGIVNIVAEVEDEAGLLTASIQCVIGDGTGAQTVPLKPAGTTDQYSGLFDSRKFTLTDVWPVMSCRAADTLGNESHRDIQVALDNARPIVALDPDTLVFIGRVKQGALQCSHPFDPVGPRAANDDEIVPQVVPIRAWIEDQGNPVASAAFVPIATIDDQAVWLYVLDGTDSALVVDSTGDGFCDSINPDVVPLSSVPQAGKAIAVNLGPVPVAGDPNFTPWTNEGSNVFPFPQCSDGDDPAPPDPLCQVTELTTALFHPGVSSLPSLYTIPPVDEEGSLQCLGLPFDFGANAIANGWACAAVAATDEVGNLGVSPPLRLWVNKNASLSQKGATPPASAGTPPSCTGTMNPATGAVNSNQPCTFRVAGSPTAQLFPASRLLIQ